MEHRRLLWVLPLLAAIAMACGSAATEVTGADATRIEAEESGTIPPTVQNPTETTTVIDVAESTTTTLSDRPIAPDFTLSLGTGGSYTLSESDKPVYLVFWAEW